MSNTFGPKKPLFGPYTYRVKQNSNGDTLIAVYHGSKRIAHIDAFWAYSMRVIEEHEAEEAARGRGKRLVCATDLRALGAEGRYPNVLAVGHAFMDDDAYKGKGIGRAMYEAMMAEGFAVRQTRIGGQPGPMFFIPDECKGAGNTSAEARRVWASLVRDYPSQGTSIRVDAPPVIGSRKRTNPRRRRNPEDYHMRHRPSVDGPFAHELGKGEYMPADVLQHPEWYTGFQQYLRGFWPALRAAQRRPKAVLRIYRALPKPHATFREGDWVTLSRDYAQEHLESNLGDEGHIIEADVPADTLRFAGDDLMEWGYWGPTVEAAPVRRRRNPRRPTTAERTDPALWEAVKREVTAGSKGGVRGEWSARKAQLSVALYKKRGGGYLGPKSPRNALAKWTREDWRTQSGDPSLVTGERYLPARAIAALTPAEYAATTRAKRAGLRRDEQFTAQPERIAAKTARYRR
jgi:GNAT superfamily N-acetyltransferase